MGGLTAIIPARSGSKRIKNKNLLELNGKSLINLSVDFALQCNINKIIVSSDSDEYLDSVVSKNVTLHKRSILGSSDEASDFDVFNEIQETYKIGPDESICWLRPCSPFRSVKLFSEMYEMHLKHQKAVRSLRPVRERPEWMYKFGNNHQISPLDMSSYNQQSKFLDEIHIVSGQIDINFANNISSSKSLVSLDSLGVVDLITPYVIDIDYMDEYKFATSVVGETSATLNYI